MRTVRAGLIQASGEADKEALVAKHVEMIGRAAGEGVEILCLQELFFTRYFGMVQNRSWFAQAEPVPGPTIEKLQKTAQRHRVVLIAPIFEKAAGEAYYNTAVVIDSSGGILGCYRKQHIPQREGFMEKFYFKPGDTGSPVFETAACKIGVFIDYDRHYPEVARALALKGAKILFNPCTTILSLSRYLWFLEQRAHAVANSVFVGTINRVGTESLSEGVFYGTSYFCDPFGEVLVQGSDSQDDIVVADLDLSRIDLARQTWNFFRDRRPDTYGEIVEPSLGCTE